MAISLVHELGRAQRMFISLGTAQAVVTTFLLSQGRAHL